MSKKIFRTKLDSSHCVLALSTTLDASTDCVLALSATQRGSSSTVHNGWVQCFTAYAGSWHCSALPYILYYSM